jgi:hypothetical protein
MVLLIMILLFSEKSGDEQNWFDGEYSRKTFQHETVAACEQHRQRMIASIERGDKDAPPVTLLSKCGSGKDDTWLSVHVKSTPTKKKNDELGS